MTWHLPWQRLIPRHHRVAAFWVAAGLGVAAPWIGQYVRTADSGTVPLSCTVSDDAAGDTRRAACDGVGARH
jgi:hypothetical protein